jgi:hypothetical protein
MSPRRHFPILMCATIDLARNSGPSDPMSTDASPSEGGDGAPAAPGEGGGPRAWCTRWCAATDALPWASGEPCGPAGAGFDARRARSVYLCVIRCAPFVAGLPVNDASFP